MIHIHARSNKETIILTILTKIISEVFQLLHVVRIYRGFLGGQRPQHVLEAHQGLLQLLSGDIDPGHLDSSCKWKIKLADQYQTTDLSLPASRAPAGRGQFWLDHLGSARRPS